MTVQSVNPEVEVLRSRQAKMAELRTWLVAMPTKLVKGDKARTLPDFSYHNNTDNGAIKGEERFNRNRIRNLFLDDHEKRKDAEAGRVSVLDLPIEVRLQGGRGHLRLLRNVMRIVRMTLPLPGRMCSDIRRQFSDLSRRVIDNSCGKISRYVDRWRVPSVICPASDDPAARPAETV